MNKTHLKDTSVENKIIANIIMSHLKEAISVQAMNEYTTMVKTFPRTLDIADSMIGLFYIFSMVVNSKCDAKVYFIDNSLLIAGRMNGIDQFWIELNGWYLFTDGRQNITIGSVEDFDRHIYETTSANDIYEAMFRKTEAQSNSNAYT